MLKTYTVLARGSPETITITVPCRIDAKTGDAVLGGEALRLIDKTKARHMGLLLPEDLCLLRERLRLNQAEMAEVLQIGAKSYSRWENGRERPSRSINILLRALWDGKVDVSYLRSIRSTKFNWWPKHHHRGALRDRGLGGAVFGCPPAPLIAAVVACL